MKTTTTDNKDLCPPWVRTVQVVLSLALGGVQSANFLNSDGYDQELGMFVCLNAALVLAAPAVINFLKVLRRTD